MRLFVLLACLFSATAIAYPRVDSTMQPCPLLDADYERIESITRSERLDIASRKLLDSDLPDGEYHWVCDYKLTKSGTDPVDPPPVDCDVTPRPASCPPIDPPPVDCDAEPRPASCPPIDPPPVDCDAEPSHSDCPPTDPNEPVDPPVENCGKQSDGSWIDCPEPTVQYQPDLPALGDYSVAGVCEAFDYAATVTLQDGEALNNAFDRLAAKGEATGAILIPWNVDTLQCDQFRPSLNDAMHTLGLLGQPGPNGEQPRFYCRRSDFDGTIVRGKGFAGYFAQVRNGRQEVGGKEQRVNFLMENIHVDGYAQWVYMPTALNIRMRNNYMHHATNDGITTPSIGFNDTDKDGIDFQACGNEISHAGNGNASHCLYLHRSERASFGTTIDVKFVDNVIHSCNYSSAFKSIANTNLVAGNKFYKRLETDPSYTPKGSQMMVDIPTCSQGLEISDNLFYYNRVDAGWMPGNSMIGLRNRANMYGCDIPQPPYLKENIKLPDGTKVQCYRDPLHPACAIPTSEFWNDSYWTANAPTNVIPLYIKNNRFEVPADAYKGDVAVAVESWGSFPYFKPSMNNKSCVLPKPNGWYERTMAYLTGNTYVGMNPAYAVLESPMFTESGTDSCGVDYVGNPESNWDLITQGAGETYISAD